MSIGRSYLRFDEDVFLRQLSHLGWESFDESNDPEKLWNIFLGNITKVLDDLCPFRRLTVVDNKPDWLNNDLLVLMRQRDRAYRRARRTNLIDDWDIARHLRNMVNMAVKTSKANVIRDKLERYQHSPKKFWQEINKLLPSSKNNTIIGISDESSGREIPTDMLGDHINDYFSTIGSKLAKGCTPGVRDHIGLHRDDNLTEFNRSPFTELEVLKVCKDINASKSSSLEHMKSLILKCAFISNIGKITKIVNASLLQSKFPQAWKLSTIVPLPKLSQPKTASDLRPVALTPLPGKLLEKLICSRLQNWLNSNKLLTEVQHGFRKNKSTVSAIAKFLNDIYTIINQRRNPYIIFLDFKKAFDTVSQSKLLYKLKLMGLDLLTLQWFESYLTNRQQCVKINNSTSNLLPILYGVPQGSILGPILFSIYINEIANIVDCGIVLYADDTVIYHHDRSALQKNLNKIAKWCNDNVLTINAKKSHWMKLRICSEILDGGILNHNQIIEPFTINRLELSRVDLYKIPWSVCG